MKDDGLAPPSPHAQRVGEGGWGDEGRPDRWNVHKELRRRRVEMAREFRSRPTASERILWSELRGRKVAGVKFRRQQPIGPFIVDFYAPALRLIIEIDGSVHFDQQDDDRERQHRIQQLGFRFLRISADAVERDLGRTIKLIEQVARELEEPSPPAPLP